MSVHTNLSASQIDPSDDYFTNANQQIAQPLLSTPAQSDPESRRKLMKVIYMGFSFFMLFTGVISGSNLIFRIYFDLQYYSLQNMTSMVFSIVFLVSLFIMPGIIKNWPYKLRAFVGSIGYLFTLLPAFLITFYRPNDNDYWSTTTTLSWVSLISAIINGLTAPMLWISANQYVTGCTNELNKGTYLGIFMSFYVGAQLIGILLAMSIMKYLGQFSLCLVATKFIIFALILFYCAPNVDKYDEEPTNEGVCQKAKKIIKLAASPRIRLFLPYCLCVGLLASVFSSVSRTVFNVISDYTAQEKDDIMLLIFISQNIAGLFACYCAGFLADKIPLKVALSIFIGFSSLGIVLSYISFVTEILPLCYVMAGFLVKGYSGSLVLINVVMVKDFGGTIEAFALSEALKIFGTIVGRGLAGILEDSVTVLSVMLLFLVLTQISVLFYRSISSSKIANKLEQPSLENVQLILEAHRSHTSNL